MTYAVKNGSFVWVGPGPEPRVGETKPAYEARAGVPVQPVTTAPSIDPTMSYNGYAAPVSQLQPVQPVVAAGTPILWPGLILPALGFLFGWLFGDGGNGNGQPPQLPNGNGYPRQLPTGRNGGLGGPQGEAFADWGGVGKHGREGVIGPGRTTTGTGWIDAETFRAWDPLQQRYYQLENGSEYSDISFAVGKMAPDGNQIVKSWVTHAWRRDNSLASTQMARLANGRMMSMSETGVIKTWRPVKNIVMARGKTTLSQAVTAQRYLDKLWRKVARKTKQLKLA